MAARAARAAKGGRRTARRNGFNDRVVDFWDPDVNAAGWWGLSSPFGCENNPLDYFTAADRQRQEQGHEDGGGDGDGGGAVAGSGGPGEAWLDGAVECMLEAGETIYVPAGWWHTVLNTEDTVAVTENFMSPHNARSPVAV